MAVIQVFDCAWLSAIVMGMVLMLKITGSLFALQVQLGDKTPLLLIVLFLSGVLSIIFSLAQLFFLGIGEYFRDYFYTSIRNFFIAITLWMSALFTICWPEVQNIQTIPVWLMLSNGLWVIGLIIGDKFPQYRRDRTVIWSIRNLVSRDPLESESQFSKITMLATRFQTLRSRFRTYRLWPRSGSIALPAEIGGLSPSLTDKLHTMLLPLMNESRSHKAVWCAVNGAPPTQLAQEIFHLFHSSSLSDPDSVVKVDLSQTHSIFWPIILGLATASPVYRQEYGINTPMAIQWSFPEYRPKDLRPLRLYHNSAEIVQAFISEPLARIRGRLGMENMLPRVTLIVHGVSNRVHASELVNFIHELEVYLPGSANFINLVIVSGLDLFRTAVQDFDDLLEHVCVVHVLDSETAICSKDTVEAPPCSKSFSKLLWDGVFCTGGDEAKRVMPILLSIIRKFNTTIAVTTEKSSPESIFSALYAAATQREQLLQCVAELPTIPQFRVDESIGQDNIAIAEALQVLFRTKQSSWKRDLITIPREHSLVVLNLAHQILDRGLPQNIAILNWKTFASNAHRLVASLSAALRLMPAELSITEIKLSNPRPVSHGGFSDIYRGECLSESPNASGQKQTLHVALKVLRIFQDHTSLALETMRNKFFKEALVWRYLEHPNIVPFLGVDSATFPSPAMAMVTQWMPNGNVLDYVGQNSPCSRYAVQLLRDCGEGLKYLHSMGIVHGDLRGGNILVDEHGVARLTDFGLASFIDSDTSGGKSSTRSGTTRWMAPELLVPSPGQTFKRTHASDVWAFGCVCCEIWTEGTQPFAQILSEPGVVIAFSQSSRQTPSWLMPYQTIPVDKGEVEMPQDLWEVVRSCWALEAQDRPLITRITEDAVFTRVFVNSNENPDRLG
ncbi:kinase-like domain-containing protein [Favolaschia claudopus]|uniref:Kinase-like domain-containing protein n=1 Tax=Favolaschia claudopus TaxID=2862362 RepID=A0AAW0D513_9AGAR